MTVQVLAAKHELYGMVPYGAEDGRFDVRWKGVSIPCTVFDKISA
ncbi:hypothetical protein [Octadecabacter antarcticus]